MNQIPKKRLDALFQILPTREMPDKTRQAARLVFESGYSYKLASLRTQVSSKRISLAVRKLNRIDVIMREAYRL